MNIQIPSDLRVFRRLHDNGHKGNWHILAKSSNNGFVPKSHPLYSEWWDSETHTAVCGTKEDGRQNSHGFVFDGKLEWSTLGKIKTICPSCMPILKVYPELANKENEHPSQPNLPNIFKKESVP